MEVLTKLDDKLIEWTKKLVENVKEKYGKDIFFVFRLTNYVTVFLCMLFSLKFMFYDGMNPPFVLFVTGIVCLFKYADWQRSRQIEEKVKSGEVDMGPIETINSEAISKKSRMFVMILNFALFILLKLSLLFLLLAVAVSLRIYLDTQLPKISTNRDE